MAKSNTKIIATVGPASFVLDSSPASSSAPHPPLAPTPGPSDDRLAIAKDALDRCLDKDISIPQIAMLVCMHPDTFTRHFRQRYGQTPATYRVAARLDEAARLVVARPELSVRRVATMVGFRHFSYFHRLFRDRFGVSPAVYAGRKHHRLAHSEGDADLRCA